MIVDKNLFQVDYLARKTILFKLYEFKLSLNNLSAGKELQATA